MDSNFPLFCVQILRLLPLDHSFFNTFFTFFFFFAVNFIKLKQLFTEKLRMQLETTFIDVKKKKKKREKKKRSPTQRVRFFSRWFTSWQQFLSFKFYNGVLKKVIYEQNNLLQTGDKKRCYCIINKQITMKTVRFKECRFQK